MSHIVSPEYVLRYPVMPPPAARIETSFCASGWFAVYTTARHEKRIAQHLAIRGIEHFLPLYTARRKWNNGARVELELPLFPGYLFVHIARPQRVRVLEVPGVLAIVGGAGKQPAMLDENQVEAIRGAVDQGKAHPHPLLLTGRRGRICRGIFTGAEGVVVRVRDNYRVVLTVELIMQSIAVEVDLEDLEILASV